MSACSGTSNGASGRRAPVIAVSSRRRSTRPPGRCSRETPTTRNSATAWRSGTRRVRRTRSRATGRSSSGATARWPGRRLCRGPTWQVAPAADSIPARRCRSRSRSRRGSRARSRSSSARRATGPRAISLVERYSSLSEVDAALARATRFWDDTLGHRAGAHARRLVRPAGQPLAAVPDAELPHLGALRAVPARRRVRLPRSAAGRAWRCSTRARICAGRTCCARRRGSSSRATCSTGGIRRPAAAPGRGAPTICCGCRTSWPRTCVTPATTSVLDEPVPFLEAPPLEAVCSRRRT